MDLQRFNALVDGAEPTLADYAALVALAKELPVELLWELLHGAPKMHWLLSGVVNKQLQEKVPEANVVQALDAIATELMVRKAGAI
ncbi:hypothetical protein D9X30_3312 [Cupriavidus sp. U2]|uniref:hypothetical protein n=1 Tax=Cupriavidus sp. U2 TaxID=2920269 RepID=UPI00129DD2DD|nr:hypothetical protein [Cupriavidus sp. U2]KAI3591787.1 hypothetical protein D9X30_3312 [Cupriavidus sp. U2]